MREVRGGGGWGGGVTGGKSHHLEQLGFEAILLGDQLAEVVRHLRHGKRTRVVLVRKALFFFLAGGGGNDKRWAPLGKANTEG